MTGMEESLRERAELQENMLALANRDMKRFLGLDAAVYRDGKLPARQKELLGLVASLVLRCDDCINYHLARCHEAGYTTGEMVEAMSVAMVVGGSITIPHVRRALRSWKDMMDAGGDGL